ncbi:MAG: hypothetical protein FWH12_06525 [Treponema sp.]|nr:hypothetical protein [Treponema sp.]
MKKNKLFGFTILVAAAALLFAVCSGPTNGGGGGGNGGGNGGDDGEGPSIRIMRSTSTSTAFSYQIINYDSSITYETRLTSGGGAIGTWSGNTATVTSGLTANTFTSLTARATKDGETETSTLPGMLKYAGDSNTVKIAGYNDWLSVLKSGLEALDDQQYESEVTQAIATFYQNWLQELVTINTSNLTSIEAQLTNLNNSMALVLKYPNVTVPNINIAQLTRIWFNWDGLISTANRNVLDPIMLNIIKTTYPRVTAVN